MNISNPFSPGYPVSPELFMGRKHILEAVKIFLEAERPSLITDVEILGRRGTGKTSTMLKLKSMVRDCLVIYLAGRSCNEIDFIGEFFMLIERELRSRYDKPISFVEFFNAIRDGQNLATSAIAEALSRIGDLSILILLDDANLVPLESLIALKSAIYQLRLRQKARALIVFGSFEPISKKLARAGLSPVEALTTKFMLKNFNPPEVNTFLSRYYPKWTEISAGMVYKITEGRPLLVQMYGSAYYDFAESDVRFKALSEKLNINTEGKSLSWKLGAFVTDTSQKVLFAKLSEELVSKCDLQVKKAMWRWYKQGWRRKPSEAEIRIAIVIAQLGGSARFIDIKREFGRNPAPQLKRGVEKGIIEQRKRGEYAIPHPILAQAIREDHNRLF
jgi:hypothetical protein